MITAMYVPNFHAYKEANMETKELSCTVSTKINLGNYETLDVSFNKTVVIPKDNDMLEQDLRDTLFADVREGLNKQIMETKAMLRQNKVAYH